VHGRASPADLEARVANALAERLSRVLAPRELTV
jgi:hypothetical protein